MIRSRAFSLTFGSSDAISSTLKPRCAENLHHVYHPNHPQEIVDVAIARFHYTPPDAIPSIIVSPKHVLCWMVENLLTTSVAQQSSVGSGHEVGLAGLFVHHQGATRNIPIIRTGNIAAMPLEPISTRMGKLIAFLVEVRSVGGLSGSPVFVATKDKLGVIGLVHGHFDQRSTDVDAADEDGGYSFHEERINSGIAIVVPADKILETLKPLIDRDFYG